MTTPADQPDLITWLHQQIDDDEQWARDALSPSQPIDRRIVGVSEAVVAGIARRMLIEVDVKRRILDEYEAQGGDVDAAPPGWDGIVKQLALPHADRPGYRPEWRP